MLILVILWQPFSPEAFISFSFASYACMEMKWLAMQAYYQDQNFWSTTTFFMCVLPSGFYLAVWKFSMMLVWSNWQLEPFTHWLKLPALRSVLLLFFYVAKCNLDEVKVNTMPVSDRLSSWPRGNLGALCWGYLMVRLTVPVTVTVPIGGGRSQGRHGYLLSPCLIAAQLHQPLGTSF